MNWKSKIRKNTDKKPLGFRLCVSVCGCVRIRLCVMRLSQATNIAWLNLIKNMHPYVTIADTRIPTCTHTLTTGLRWFSIINRTVVGGILAICRDSVGVFYRPSRLGQLDCSPIVIIYTGKCKKQTVTFCVTESLDTVGIFCSPSQIGQFQF